MPLNFDDGRSGEVGQESPYFQWGPRGAPACTSGFLSLGHHPIWGAAGAFDCDISYNQGNGLEMVISGQTSGYRPIPNVWHHVVVSYSGGVGPWSVFVDGQQVSSLAGRSISTTRMANIHIGSWFSTGGAGMTAASAIHSFRFHTGALSADDVAFNWGQVQYALALAAGGGSGPAVTSAWSLSTLGYQTAKLDIAGFGASVAGAVVTYSGPNPASPGQRIIYPAGIDRPRSNSSVLIITTTPGVGSDLVFNVSVPGVGWALSRGAIAAYAFPTITGISGGRVQSSVAGGTSFVVTGTSFGPLSLPGYGAYIPTVTYGGDQGANFTATSCTRAAATAHTAITCRTSPGAGSGWVPRVCVGGTGQCSAPPTATLAIDYPAPNITGLFGALIMNTAGGERLVATGFNLGTPVTTGLYPVSLQWGPPGGTFPYSGSQCTLERVSQASSNMQLSCNTVAGRGGAGLVARIRIGNSVSNVLAGTGLRFAPPVIQTLEGPGALDGPTTGLAEVNITGSNFGWDSSALSVTYTYRLTGPIPGVTTVIPGGQGLNAFAPNNVTYRPPVCVIAVNHTVITCLTAAGSGSGMEWRVVVAGQTNANPTSSYAAPVITGYQILERLTNADITAVGAAAGGNSTIVVQGTGFGPATAAPGGPIPLLQAVYLVSPAGVKTLLATSSYSLQSDASLRVRLPPGSGGGWAMSVRVADRDSTSPTGASWQYALPVVQAVDCGGGSARAPTAGGVTCTVTGANFPLDDPAAQMVVLFGNPADGSLLSSALRAAPVYSALSRIMPNTVTFALPPGAGVARAVRLTSYRSGESVPNPAAFTASPAPQTQNCLPGVACTGVDVVTYSDPTLAMLVVTRPTVQAQWDLANAVFGSASASTVRVVTILGSGFGPAPGTIAGVNPEAIVRDVHLLVSSQWVPLSLTWSVATPAPFAIDSASLAPSWTDSRIVLLTNLVNATIRLALTSQSWDGSPIAQLSNILSYVDLNPAVVVTIPGPYPTTGRDLATGLPVSVPFTVQHLDWSSQGSLNVTVGGQPCPLVAADGVTVVPPSSYQSAILTNPAFYSPSGVNVSIGPDTVWSFRCLLPAGQGINQNLIVTRLPDGRSSSTAAGVSGISASSVIYSSPSILTMSVDGTAPITVAGSSVRTRIDPSGGSIISLTGINFGVCPSVTFAAATLYYCGSGCACTPQQLAASENVTRNDAHTQITFTAPAGEGDGVAQTGSADGWTLTVSAGGQSARTDVIKVGYLGPVITSVESLATGAQPHFPTRGGVRIRINGRGFGVTATGTGILPPPALRVYIGNGTFVDPDVPSGGSGGDTGVIALCNVTSGPPWNRTTTQVPCPTPPPSAAALTWWSCGSPTRVSQVVIECSLPEGAGASLAAVVIVAGQVGRSAGPVLSYNPPVIRTLSSSLADSGATRCGGVNSVPSFIPATNVAGELRGPTTGGFRVNISGSDFGLRTGANGSCVFVPWQFRPIGEGAPRLRCDGFESWAGEGEIYGPLVETWTHESIVFCMPHGLGALDVAVFSAGQFSALRDAPANASDPSSAPGPTFAYIEPQITGTNPNSGGVLGGTFTTISGQNFGVGLASLTGYGGGGGGNNNVPNIQLPYPLPLPSNWQPQHLKGLQIVWGGGCIAVQPTGNASAALGAGACPRGRITAQTHNQIVFITPPGSGAFTVGVRVLDGDRVFMATVAANNETQWAYDMPELASLSIVNGSTTGGAFMAVSGNNLQNPGAGQGMRINWGPQPRSVSSLTPGGMCAATTPQIPGTLQCANNTVTPSTFGQNAGRRVTFFSLPGVGRNINVSLSLIDEDGNVFTSNVLPSWSYNPPRLTGFTPNPILVGDESPTILATGTEFGSEAVIAAYRAAGAGDLLTSLSVSFNDDPSMICAGTVPSRIVLAYDSDDTPTVQFCLNRTAARVGYHNASVFAAGQQGTLYDAEEGAMMVGCKPGYFGWPGENCVPCPPGAKCDGYVSDIRFALEGTRDLLTAQAAAMRLRVDARMGGIHWYPRPLEGYFNLNSSDANYPEGAFGASRQAAQCPPSAVIRGRDVCIVACLPAEACLGDNVCAVGYKSKAPLFRCATCDTGYYKRNGECIKCPDSPIALVIGFLLLVIVGAGCAYVLQKKNINIAYISIGVDFFQVVAMFANARVPWPPALKNLFQILSAFNLNIEVVTPECLAPDLSFKEKFAAIMLLPVCIGVAFLAVHFALVVYKSLVLKRARKKLATHVAPFVSSLLLLFYMLYLFLAKTTLDVFNCQPSAASGDTAPDLDANGKVQLYLQATNELCGVPGGTQAALIPGAIAAFVVYIAGYPIGLAALFYFKRELIVEDQLLRAKGVGNDRLENPNAYRVRRMFSRVYYQFKPDMYWWNCVIIMRKFAIALVSLMFARNASFQLAACLLVLFASFALQTHWQPYMPPSECEAVLRAHEISSLTDPLHAKLRAKLAAIQSRGRKRTRHNVMTPSGKIDVKALLGVLATSLFNYNTVEQTLLASAIVVALMGILFAATGTGENPYASRGSEAISSIVIIVICLTIVYFFTVVFVEVYVLWNEEARRASMLKRRSSKQPTKGGSSISIRKSVSPKGIGGHKAVEIGMVTQENNPLFITGAAGATAEEVAAFSGDRQALIDALNASTAAPSAAFWAMFKGQFLSNLGQMDAMSSQLLLATAAAGSATCSVCGSQKGPGGASAPASTRRAFGPISTATPAQGGGEPHDAPDGTGAMGGLGVFRSSRTAAVTPHRH